ncbi:hypothetical protein LPJ73_000302 [Coemansia sp. RSA 2703]|nr:hypothetical protein LPJ73_000302 [Coemansia sp. RSA 2703]KAJ2373548.1 hypothetical protein IW150_003571 [Coemansia sp. RSA 2607]KAJ2396563.1 hypothetical protein GGI05_001054 [Coemansia sp. RSA 2603]
MEDSANASNGNTARQFLVGAVGGEKIKRMMSLGNPKQAIVEFSREGGLDIPASETIYGLLDSLGYTRWNIHNSVLESTILAAQKQIQNASLSNEDHLRLLDQIKPYLSIKRLRHLPLLLMAQRPDLISDDIRMTIKADQSIYNQCSVGIKQELWKHDQDLFKQSVLLLIRNYSGSDELVSMAREMSGAKAREFAVSHRKHSALIEIAHAVGSSLQLYMQMLGMVRDELVDKNDSILGTLRSDIVVVMQQIGMAEVVKDDICLGLVRALDASILRQSIDESCIDKLKAFFDGFGDDELPYGEIALIFSDPYVRHVLAQYILAILEDIAPNADVSQRRKDVDYPNLVLSIGLSAQRIIDGNLKNFPRADRDVKRKFYETLIAFIGASQQRDQKARMRDQLGDASKRPQISRASSTTAVAIVAVPTVIEESGLRPTQEDLNILARSELARQTLYAYLLKRVTYLDLGMLNVWLSEVGKIISSILELPNGQDALTSTLAHLDLAATPRSLHDPPSLPKIPLTANVSAFELDAFVQSLVTHIKETRGMASVILSSILQDSGSVANNNVNRIAAPFVLFLDQAARVRHCAHEQVVRFLAHCSSVVFAGNAGAPDTNVAEEKAMACLIFKLAEYAAANYVVDPQHSSGLRKRYLELASASPEHAFEYRICASNCPNVARFLE